ncbi:MAG TPA: hypothetical protein VFX37_05290 [Pseudolabrys sp.]|nr:hypothetical protein [Pseudolabrys sp.]
MTNEPTQAHHRVAQGLHPLVYKGIAGLALWFVLSVWVLFDRGPYMLLTIAAITGFFIIVVAIPFFIWLTWRKSTGARPLPGQQRTFQNWTHGEFQTWTGPLSGREAATQIILPIAAVSLGITAFGLVLYFTLPSLGYS